MRTARRTIFVDHEVQGALVWRVLFYWNFFVIAIPLVLLAREMCVVPGAGLGDAIRGMASRYSPVLFVSLLLLPLVMLDIVRTTNRMTGPIFRLRRALKEVADGLPAKPLNFREHDFWRELAVDFNRAAARAAAAPSTFPSQTEDMRPAAGEGALV
jgi:hypothetical protein